MERKFKKGDCLSITAPAGKESCGLCLRRAKHVTAWVVPHENGVQGRRRKLANIGVSVSLKKDGTYVVKAPDEVSFLVWRSPWGWTET